MALSKHHVPPKCYRKPGTFVIKVPKSKHKAYHDLLGIPPTFDEARRILAERRNDYVRGQLNKNLAQALQILFVGTAIRERDMAERLLDVWWTRRYNTRSRYR
jgi:hypothetical protein